MARGDDITNVETASVPFSAGKPQDVDFELQDLHRPTDVQDEESSVPRSPWRIFAIMTALLLCLFLFAICFLVVSTAVPTIASYFHSASGYIWIGSSLALADAAACPIWGKLSDIWGRKPMLLIATAIVFISSIICATAVDMTMLIVGRSLQGVGASGLILLVNICISDLFSVRQRGLYFSLCELVWALSGAVGPIIGGAFAEYTSWRWCWYINLPLAAIAFILVVLYLDVHNPRTPMAAGLKAIDWAGTLTILGFTLMLLLGLDFGGTTFPWDSPRIICLIVFGCVMSGFFVFSEIKIAKYPVLPFRIMQTPSNIAAFVIGFAHGFVFIGAEYYLPLYFQSVKQVGALESGILVLPLSVAEAVTGIGCGLIMHRTGRYLEMIRIGALLHTLGVGLLILFDRETSMAEIVGLELVLGLGAGILFNPPLIAIQAQTPQSDTAVATSTFSFVRNLATCLSLVIGGVVFQNSMTLQRPHLRAAGISEVVLEQLSGSSAAANVKVIGMLHGDQQIAAKDAYARSMRNLWIMYCAMTGCSVIASYFITKEVMNTEHTETRTGLTEEEKKEKRSRALK